MRPALKQTIRMNFVFDSRPKKEVSVSLLAEADFAQLNFVQRLYSRSMDLGYVFYCITYLGNRITLILSPKNACLNNSVKIAHFEPKQSSFLQKRMYLSSKASVQKSQRSQE